MFRDLQQVQNAQKSRLPRQLRRNIWKPDRLNRIDFNLAFLHPVPPAHSHAGTHPYPHTASDLPATYSLAQPFSERHENSLRPTLQSAEFAKRWATGKWPPEGKSLHSESHALKRLMSQKYARSNPPTTFRPAANRDLYRQRKPHAATRSPVSDIAVQNRFDGKSGESNTNDRNKMEATAAIASGRIRAICLRLERSRRISITVADAKQERGMLIRTIAAFIKLIGRGSLLSIRSV